MGTGGDPAEWVREAARGAEGSGSGNQSTSSQLRFHASVSNHTSGSSCATASCSPSAERLSLRTVGRKIMMGVLVARTNVCCCIATRSYMELCKFTCIYAAMSILWSERKAAGKREPSSALAVSGGVST